MTDTTKGPGLRAFNNAAEQLKQRGYSLAQIATIAEAFAKVARKAADLETQERKH